MEGMALGEGTTDHRYAVDAGKVTTSHARKCWVEANRIS